MAGIETSHLFNSLQDTLAYFTGTFLIKMIELFLKTSHPCTITITVIRQEVSEQVIAVESFRITYTKQVCL